MIKIIAKGPQKAVKNAAANFGITGLVITRTNDLREVICNCPENEDNSNAVMKWFSSDAGTGAPYPPGSCLWYGWSEYPHK